MSAASGTASRASELRSRTNFGVSGRRPAAGAGASGCVEEGLVVVVVGVAGEETMALGVAEETGTGTGAAFADGR